VYKVLLGPLVCPGLRVLLESRAILVLWDLKGWLVPSEVQAVLVQLVLLDLRVV